MKIRMRTRKRTLMKTLRWTMRENSVEDLMLESNSYSGDDSGIDKHFLLANY